MFAAILLTTSVFFAPPVQEVQRDLHPDGSLWVERQVLGDSSGGWTLEGAFRRLTPDGVVVAEGRFDSGTAQGRWIFRHPNGASLTGGRFHDGEPIKQWTFLRPDGSNWAEGVCSGGGREGRWKFFLEDGRKDTANSGLYTPVVVNWDDGRPLLRGERMDGEPHGVWKSWWRDGTLRERIRFDTGRIVRRQFFHRDGSEEAGLAVGSEPESPWPTLPQPVELARGPLFADSLPALVEQPDPELARRVDLLLRASTGDRARDAEVWKAIMPQSVPYLIDALGSKGQNAKDAATIASCLSIATDGRALGWDSAKSSSEEPNRTTLLRWHSLWSATSHDALLWRVLLPDGSTDTDSALDFEHLVVPRALPARRVLKDGQDAGTQLARQALRAGLHRLTLMQRPDGSWWNQEASDPELAKVHSVGLTGLAVLAFHAGGRTLDDPNVGDSFARAVRYLTKAQDESGLLAAAPSSDRIYSHLIASLALAEVIGPGGAGRVPMIDDILRRSMDLTMSARSKRGGWHYEVPSVGEVDTSVTAWAIQSLAAIQRTGIDVPDVAFMGALSFLRDVTDPSTSRVGYDIHGAKGERLPANEQFELAGAVESMTGAGVVIRTIACEMLSRDVDERLLGRQRRLISGSPPEWGITARRDLYGWMWCTRAMRIGDGRAGRLWSAAVAGELVEAQESDGAWPASGVWGTVAGRAYSTAMACLALTEALAPPTSAR